MSTIRVERRRRFTTVDRHCVNDARLSFRARGLLIWLLDKPDDWRCNSTQIANGCKEGRDAIRATLRELELAGYISRERICVDGGKWVTETIVRERPTEDGFPGVGEPGVGNPGANTNTDTEDCYPQTPTRKVVCMGCAADVGAPCRLVEAFPGTEPEACPWRKAS